MKIVLFVYDFPHKKSLKGMQLLKSQGIRDVFVVASPKIELKFRQSTTRVSVIENEIIEPIDLSKEYSWEYLVANHNSELAINYFKKIKPTIGIILGARILSKNVIENFSKGIINFHPGVLPENRGLDNLKWAIYNNLPQGVTTHFIDENIDVGFEIYKELIEIDGDDTLFDVNSKLFDLQIQHLSNLISNGFNVGKLKPLDSNYNSQKAVSDEIDKKVFLLFENYKKQYADIVKNYS
jgi:methionyl-tRNA formyltransferase